MSEQVPTKDMLTAVRAKLESALRHWECPDVRGEVQEAIEMIDARMTEQEAYRLLDNDHSIAALQWNQDYVRADGLFTLDQLEALLVLGRSKLTGAVCGGG